MSRREKDRLLDLTETAKVKKGDDILGPCPKGGSFCRKSAKKKTSRGKEIPLWKYVGPAKLRYQKNRGKAKGAYFPLIIPGKGERREGGRKTYDICPVSSVIKSVGTEKRKNRTSFLTTHNMLKKRGKEPDSTSLKSPSAKKTKFQPSSYLRGV